MSTMRISAVGLGQIDLYVKRFSSSMTGTIESSQTKDALHHYPRKADQQEFEAQVVFPSTRAYANFQTFVMRHHYRATQNIERPEVTIWWPQRGIRNWSGIIEDFQSGDERFNPAPKASIRFLLVDSLLSQKTWASSFGEDFSKFFDNDIGNPSDPIFTPPAPLPGLPSDVPLPIDVLRK